MNNRVMRTNMADKKEKGKIKILPALKVDPQLLHKYFARQNKVKK